MTELQEPPGSKVHARRYAPLRLRWRRLGPLLLFLAQAACTAPRSQPAGPASGEWRTFGGTWSAVGERHTLHLGPDRQASIARLTGSLVLTQERGLGLGFLAEAIVFSDSQTGGVGRSVWTDDRGDQVFSELRAGPAANEHQIIGTIIGGTGRYRGATGEFEFHWQYMIDAEDGVIQGRAVGLRGRARVERPPADSPAGG